MNRGSLYTRSFRRIQLAVFKYRLTKSSFAGPKRFRGFRETGPWSWNTCMIYIIKWNLPRQYSHMSYWSLLHFASWETERCSEGLMRDLQQENKLFVVERASLVILQQWLWLITEDTDSPVNQSKLDCKGKKQRRWAWYEGKNTANSRSGIHP